MQPPKRIRLLHVLYNRLYSRVKVQLATDKEIRALHELGSRIAKYYDKQTTATESTTSQLTLI
jgi:hypothetical protein